MSKMHGAKLEMTAADRRSPWINCDAIIIIKSREIALTLCEPSKECKKTLRF